MTGAVLVGSPGGMKITIDNDIDDSTTSITFNQTEEYLGSSKELFNVSDVIPVLCSNTSSNCSEESEFTAQFMVTEVAIMR